MIILALCFLSHVTLEAVLDTEQLPCDGVPMLGFHVCLCMCVSKNRPLSAKGSQAVPAHRGRGHGPAAGERESPRPSRARARGAARQQAAWAATKHEKGFIAWSLMVFPPVLHFGRQF